LLVEGIVFRENPSLYFFWWCHVIIDRWGFYNSLLARGMPL